VIREREEELGTPPERKLSAEQIRPVQLTVFVLVMEDICGILPETLPGDPESDEAPDRPLTDDVRRILGDLPPIGNPYEPRELVLRMFRYVRHRAGLD
jgi:hypothetical protein